MYHISGYADGAQVACGFGTAARKLGAYRIFGTDPLPERLALAKELGICDEVLPVDADNAAQFETDKRQRRAASRRLSGTMLLALRLSAPQANADVLCFWVKAAL